MIGWWLRQTWVRQLGWSWWHRPARLPLAAVWSRCRRTAWLCLRASIPLRYPAVTNIKFDELVRSDCSYFFNSLAPGRFEWNIMYVIFKLILVIDVWGISCRIARIWMPLGFTDDEATLVQVMAWCRQAPSHYLSQCWPKSLSPYDVTRPQWVNLSRA